jgi:hypothetical protein
LEQAVRELEGAKGQSEVLQKENNDLAKQVQQLLAGTFPFSPLTTAAAFLTLM